MVAGCLAVKPILSDAREAALRFALADIAIVIEQPGEDAPHIAIDGGGRFSEGDAGDGRGAIGADAGQGEQLVILAWDGAAMLPLDEAGRPLEVARARVIAEAFPLFEDGIQRRVGEGGERREGGEEALVIAQHRRHARLHQHHFREPDAIGSALAPPG